MAAFLQEIGRREIDGDALGRQRQTHGGEGGAHALAQFGDGLVGQTHDHEGGEARGDGHLGLDFERLDAQKGDGPDPRDQVLAAPLPEDRF